LELFNAEKYKVAGCKGKLGRNEKQTAPALYRPSPVPYIPENSDFYRSGL
jgi:hypothetical protein